MYCIVWDTSVFALSNSSLSADGVDFDCGSALTCYNAHHFLVPSYTFRKLRLIQRIKCWSHAASFIHTACRNAFVKCSAPQSCHTLLWKKRFTDICLVLHTGMQYNVTNGIHSLCIWSGEKQEKERKRKQTCGNVSRQYSCSLETMYIYAWKGKWGFFNFLSL